VIPRFKPALGFDELKAAFSLPKKDDVKKFEEAFAELMSQKYALAFPYGRTGLILLLEALGLKDKEIICPAYTCVVVPHAIVYSGNKPVFIDCEENGFNMDLDKAEKKITQQTGALIATSLFGYPVNLDKLDQIRSSHPHVKIIQDCAHSFAVEWKGRSVQKEGIATLFGLNISKTLTSIFGGMITTNNEDLYQKLKTLRAQNLKRSHWTKSCRRLFYLLAVYFSFQRSFYGLVNRMERLNLLDNFVQYYDENTIDMPSDYLVEMCGTEARVGKANIDKYEEVVKKRREASIYYFEQLADKPNISLPPEVEGATYSHFIIQVLDREEWLQNAIHKGIQLGWLIEYNIPEMSAYGGHRPEEFPIAAKYAKTTVNLPVWGGRKIGKELILKLHKSYI
jgi:dTDP-4-amino-4,6-dideoxygalactose transaminase